MRAHRRWSSCARGRASRTISAASASDTAPVTNDGVKEGYVMFIYDNQYYTQSFIPAMQAWQFLERGFMALDRYPTGAIVNEDNIDSVIARDDALLELGKKYGIAY